ncbi:MAG: WYL domain-containing protein [Solobacterium sp.]|nr:WYL domain-containing protein [Solobacterium sp.]
MLTSKPLILLNLLSSYSDSSHRLSMEELCAHLEDHGIHAERKAVYRALGELKDAGVEIFFSREGEKQGYWMEHTFSPAEILVLRNAVNDSPSLSAKSSALLNKKLEAQLSTYEAKALPKGSLYAGKTDNHQVLSMIEALLPAIRDSRSIKFRYYDLTVTKEKRYRRNRQNYHLLPCAVISDGGRMYCVCYSPVHQSFANYRIDRMDSLEVHEPWDPVRFDAERWAQVSFMMYHGDPVTITLQCDESLTGIVFDRFGSDVIVSRHDSTSFTVSIRSSLSPTLVSWILMFYDRIKVIAPQELIEELKTIAETLRKTYSD